MKKEIEIKIQLDKSDLAKLGTWLLSNASDEGELVISDYYFDNLNKSFLFDSPQGYKDALEFLRLRVTDKNSVLCYKKRNVDKDGKTLDVQEVETIVADSSKVMEILKSIGFIQKACIKKTRQIYLVENIFEIVIDKVEDLGVFVEIELVNDIQDVSVGMSNIYDLLRKIEIKEFKSFDRGYFCLFLNPEYDFAEYENFK